MSQGRDDARGQIATKGLARPAIEVIARTSFRRMPITMIDRARAQLRRFFSDEPWTVEDDAALSALLGPGEGWTEHELEPGVRIGFGWRGGAFRVDVEVPMNGHQAGGAIDAGTAPADAAPLIPVHERTLGDTFEEFVLIETGRSPDELRFNLGPAVTGARTGRFTREEQGQSAGVAAVFRDFEDVIQVRIDLGILTVKVAEPSRWHALLLPLFDTITNSFVPPRPHNPDRQYERALTEIGTLDPHQPRELARLVDATTSPDPAYRRLALAKLEDADEFVAQKPFTRALEDSSRAVRRAAIRAMAHIAREDVRLLFERALVDKDACVRYYALRGLSQIGVGRARESVERRKRDDDVRVRLAAEAALAGRVPA